MSAYPVQIDGEECFVFVFHDITQEQHARDALQASNSLLRQAGRLARLGVWEDMPARGPKSCPSAIASVKSSSKPNACEIVRAICATSNVWVNRFLR